MRSTQIYSAGSELASAPVKTRDMLAEAGFEDCSLVERLLGIHEVRHAPVSSKPSDLAIPAATRALADAGVPPDRIDAVIYCGIQRDCAEPATAHIIAASIGLRPFICFDISNACHGFVSGLHVADSMVRSGAIRYALVVTAALSSAVTRRVAEMFRKGTLGPADAKTHMGAFTVGDAGGAMVLGPAEGSGGIRQFVSGARSEHHGLCSYTLAGENLSFVMHMASISAVTLELVRELIEPAYLSLGWTPDDIDLFIPHQVGARAYRKTLEIVGVGADRSIAIYPRLGNLATATIPVCYDLMSREGRLRAGANVLIGSSGSGIAVAFMGLSL